MRKFDELVEKLVTLGVSKEEATKMVEAVIIEYREDLVKD